MSVIGDLVIRALSYGQGLGRREIEGLVARRCLVVRFSQWAQTLRECLSQVTVHQRALLERWLLTIRGHLWVSLSSFFCF